MVLYINTHEFFCLTIKLVIAMINKLQMQESCIMKKRFLLAAVSAALISPFAAHAGATVYGNVHLSLDTPSFEDDAKNDNTRMNSNTSAIGVKGKEDLGGGMSAIFKIEFQVDPSERNKNIVDRDQWVGLKGAMGTVKFGTMSNNYKQLGGKIDPMYRTRLEGRGFLDTQTSLHGGAGQNGGRSTNTLQYSTPKMGGMKVVFNYTFSGNDEETIGLGVHYKSKTAIAYIDYLDVQRQASSAVTAVAFVGDNPATVGIDERVEAVAGSAAVAAASETAFKIGGSYKMGDVTLGLQYEFIDQDFNNIKGITPKDSDGKANDVIFASLNYKVNGNDNFAFTLGDNGTDDVGYALMYNHKMSKRTNIYGGYGDNASQKANDEQIVTLGVRHKF